MSHHGRIKISGKNTPKSVTKETRFRGVQTEFWGEEVYEKKIRLEAKTEKTIYTCRRTEIFVVGRKNDPLISARHGFAPPGSMRRLREFRQVDEIMKQCV